MPLLPVGLETQKLNAIYVHQNNVGFWLYSTRSKLFGEARILEESKQKLKQFELNNHWLFYEISEASFDEFKIELFKSNPLKLEKEQLDNLKKNDEELKLAVETLARVLVREDITHPLLKPHRAQLKQLLAENNIFDYQKMMVYACLKNRHIDVKHIEKDEKDPEKGYISGQDVSKNIITVGLPTLQEEEIFNPFLSEDLINALYIFAVTEHNGEEYKTSKMLEEEEVAEKEEKKRQSTVDNKRKATDT